MKLEAKEAKFKKINYQLQNPILGRKSPKLNMQHYFKMVLIDNLKQTA